MSEPLEGRRYGRTTLMLQEARRLAQEGRAVYVVAVSAKDASRLRRMFGDDAGALGVKFESSEELPIRDGRRLRGAHPNCVVLVDHYVVESENTALRARIAALEADREAFAREVVLAVDMSHDNIWKLWPVPVLEKYRAALGDEITRAIAAVKAARGE